jgi:hypothetical protein
MQRTLVRHPGSSPIAVINFIVQPGSSFFPSPYLSLCVDKVEPIISKVPRSQVKLFMRSQEAKILFNNNT